LNSSGDQPERRRTCAERISQRCFITLPLLSVVSKVQPAVRVQELQLGQLGARERHGLVQLERAAAVVGECGRRDRNG
jgi:hypothetical protein